MKQAAWLSFARGTAIFVTVLATSWETACAAALTRASASKAKAESTFAGEPFLKSDVKYARRGAGPRARHRSRRRGQIVLIARDASITGEEYFDPIRC